nr:uncharacterized protein LOC106678240 [Halyomorpha halys]
MATPWIQKPRSLWRRLPFLLWDTLLVVIVVYMLFCYAYSIMTISIPFQDLFGLGISTTNYICALSVTFYHALYGPRLKKITDNMDSIAAVICTNNLGGAERFHKRYATNSKLMSVFTTLSIHFSAYLPFTYFFEVPVTDYFTGKYRSRFPVKINSPFYDREPGVYELVLGIMSLCVSSSIGKKTATDCLFMTLFMIQRNFLYFLSDSMKDLEKEFLTGDNKLFKKKLSIWIKLHQDIRRNAEELVLTFSPVIIIYYVSVIGNIVCAAFIQMKKDNDSMFQSICMSIYVMVALTYLFLLSDAAGRLTVEAEKLAFVVYSSPWYESNKTNTDTLRLVVTISNKPIHVTAYKAPVFLLNRETFLTFVASALSAFVTFSQMKDRFDQ